MDKREFKDRVYGELETLGKAVANRRRLELLDILSQGPHTVEELARETAMSVANASQHLQRLKKARLVATEQEGTYIYYRLANESVAAFLIIFQQLASERLPLIDATVQSFFRGVPTADWDEIASELARDQALLIDTRPENEYLAGHLPGAVSAPADQLDEILDQLPKDKKLVAYCRGPYCTMASQAVAQLNDAGFDALRVEMSVQQFNHQMGIDHQP
jgi:rhodanese-related sulfurtransferase/DNA-binding transcriptional ArsR family regulator